MRRPLLTALSLGLALTAAVGLVFWRVFAADGGDRRDAQTTVPSGAGETGGALVEAELAAAPGATEHVREEAAAVGATPEASAASATSARRDATGESAALHGRVLWPAGGGAAGADVALEQVGGYARDADDELPATRTDQEGRFAFEPGSTDLDLQELLEAPPGGEIRLRARIADEAGAMYAAELRAPASTMENTAENAAEGVTLVLAPVAAVRGRVVAADGSAVGAFLARLAPHNGEVGRIFEAPALAAARFDRPALSDVNGGAFALPVAEAGAMRLEVRAAGFVQTEPLVLDLPRDAEREHLVVLERAARLSGVVLTPDGLPCAGAQVLLHGATPAWLAEIVIDVPGESVKTGEDGRFAFENVVPGVAKLTAEVGSGWAPSELVSLDVAPGADVHDVRIALRRGGTIVGEMLDAQGAPIADAPVVGFHVETMTLETTQTDDDGGFALERLRPGTWQLQGIPSSDPEPDPREAAESALMEQVEVALGETVHVTLGGVHLDAVLVRGRVTAGGEPARAEVVFLPDAGAGQGRGLAGVAQTSTEDDGRYEVRVERPGDYVVLISAEASPGAPSSEAVRIPPGSEFRLDVALPDGGIAGTVRDADGSPAQNVIVTLQRSDGVVNGMPFGILNQGVSTDSEGRYALLGLAPGEYDVAVGGGSLFPTFDPSAPGGELPLVRVGGVRVASGSTVTGVDLTLVRGGRLAGRVVDADGRPVPDATVWFRAADGHVVERMSLVTTDGGGRFPGRLLPPGDYTVIARAAERVTPESAPVHVAAGETASVELVAARGVRLRVVCRPADDAAPLAGMVIELDDAAGRAMEGLGGSDAFQTLYGTGISSTAPRLGLLPPGTYRCRARCRDGRAAEAEVTLVAEDGERLLELVLE